MCNGVGIRASSGLAGFFRGGKDLRGLEKRRVHGVLKQRLTRKDHKSLDSVGGKQACGGDHGLSEGDAAVVGGDVLVGQNREALLLEGVAYLLEQTRILPDATREGDGIEPMLDL